MTVDKLGVRLYDTVSAVVAELIANGYDADAKTVTIRLPLSTTLAKQAKKTDPIEDAGFVIEVIDTGHGMTRDEANNHFLKVGRERRAHPEQGAVSRDLHRAVMGRKGIGKLAPFGICRLIEIISAGGDEHENGYLVSHFVMDYDNIVRDNDAPVGLQAGEFDGTYRADRGTTIRLSKFLPKRVPNRTIFMRQLARRFVPTAGFNIIVEDTRCDNDRGEDVKSQTVGPLDVPIQVDTRIDLRERPVTTEDGTTLNVAGWLALATEAYKNEETAGVRIYARNKIVGSTRDFEQPAGFTGEYTMRSYLVGEVTAEWLDMDDGEDLVKTDRQGIIWDSEYGNAFRAWGAALIKEMGATSRKPRRKRARDIFFERSDIRERIQREYTDESVVDAALELADKIGSFAAEDELADAEYVNDLSTIILSVAPHSALMKAFQDFEKLAGQGRVMISEMQPILRRSRIAEMASYGQISQERVRVIEQLEKMVRERPNESEFQRLLASAPWLVEPTWSVISENENLANFKKNFELWYKQRYGSDIDVAITYQSKRPDFTLVDVGHRLYIVEIKPAGHTFNDADAGRLSNYAVAFEQFFADHEHVRAAFALSWKIILVTDNVQLQSSLAQLAYNNLVQRGVLDQRPWTEFLYRARTSHEEFLKSARIYREATSAIEAEASALAPLPSAVQVL